MSMFEAKSLVVRLAFSCICVACCQAEESLREKCARLIDYPNPGLFVREIETTRAGVQVQRMLEQMPDEAIPVTIEVLSHLDKSDGRRQGGILLLRGLLETHPAGNPEYWKLVVNFLDKQVQETPDEHLMAVVYLTGDFVANHYDDASMAILARLLHHPRPRVKQLAEEVIERISFYSNRPQLLQLLKEQVLIPIHGEAVSPAPNVPSSSTLPPVATAQTGRPSSEPGAAVDSPPAGHKQFGFVLFPALLVLLLTILGFVWIRWRSGKERGQL